MTNRRPTSTRLTLTLTIVIALACAAPARAGQAQPASLDEILKQASSWDGGIESAPIWKLNDYVRAHRDDAAGRAECETKLLQFLKGPATPAAKVVASRHLRVIATDAAVPALQALLADDRVADLAIYVLQPMPGAAAERALVQALSLAPKAGGAATKTAVIVALGERRAASAIPALLPLLQQPAFAVSAATALARIGGPSSAAALQAACSGATGPSKSAFAAALLSAADGLVAARDGAAALRLYETVLSDVPARREGGVTVPLRRAAAAGKIAASGAAAPALVLEMLRGTDPDLQEAAVASVPAVFPQAGIDSVLPLMATLPDRAQVQLLAVLAGYPGERVAPALAAAMARGSEPVRVAALKTMGAVGDRRSVRVLAETGANARGQEQAAARAALGSLKGRAVDDEIVALMGQRLPDGVASELLLAVSDRRIFFAKDVVVASLGSTAPAVRSQALKSLRTVGTPSNVSAVLDLLVKSDDDAERGEAEKTAAALTLKVANPDGRSRAVRARLTASTTASERARLIAVLPLTGDPGALPALRTALADADPEVADAAARALAAWPTAAAREDLLQLARDSKNETHRLLAITGFVRTVGLEPSRIPAVAVADLKTAGDLAWRPEERKLVLGALVAFPCREALDAANGWLGDPAVKAEAQAAVEKITERLAKK